jgi:GDPmannose 4,6-dehydratase
LEEELRLGNLEARRDWGHAAEYVKAMRLMLQAPEPDDYVIATGESRSVREFCELAFAEAGLDWREHVRVDRDLLRPTEVDLLLGDASKARAQFGWRPRVTFRELVSEMAASDLELAREELARSEILPSDGRLAVPEDPYFSVVTSKR